jgi:hypothetical protein
LEYGRHGDVGQYIARPFVWVLWSGFRRHRRRSPWLFRVILEVRFFILRHNNLKIHLVLLCRVGRYL